MSLLIHYSNDFFSDVGRVIANILLACCFLCFFRPHLQLIFNVHWPNGVGSGFLLLSLQSLYEVLNPGAEMIANYCFSVVLVRPFKIKLQTTLHRFALVSGLPRFLR